MILLFSTDILSTLENLFKKTISWHFGTANSMGMGKLLIFPLFRDPIDGRKMLVKRIVAVAGDVVKTLPPYPDAEVFVPEGHVWVEGETRRFHLNKFLTLH
jgi:signal peptidase I